VVETIRLESGHTLTGIGGSNPSLSARFHSPYFGLAGIGNEVGAPSFAFCAKGGNQEPLPDGFVARYISRIRQHRTRPCQERKDGAPSVAMMHANLDGKHGPPASIF
jgi:hypothetical protein